MGGARRAPSWSRCARPGQEQEVAPPGDVGACDLVIALGGDGTTLAALRAAAPLGRPVLGVACGSLGALTAVTADDIDDALDRVARGDYEERHLPALVAEHDGGELTRAQRPRARPRRRRAR